MIGLGGLIMSLLVCVGFMAQGWARCALAPVELRQLNAQLEASSSRSAWAKVWGQLSALELQLTQTIDGSISPLTPERAVALQCLYGLQFDAAFYLTESRVEGRLWSARALGAKLLLEEIEQQSERSPSRAERAQRRLRGQALQRALSRRPKGAKWSPWMSARGAVEVSLPTLSRPVTLSIQHPNLEEWRAQCGLTVGCEERPSWTLRIPAGRASVIRLPKANYSLKWSGNCADEEGSLALFKERAKQVKLPEPTLACRSTVTLVDPRSDERWEAGVVEEGQRKELQRPGYQALEVTGREGGGPIVAELKRCEVPITWVVTPATARVDAPESIPWGVPVTVKASARGYAPLERQVELPRVERCEASPHHLDLALSRAVNLRFMTQEGRPILASAVQVSGLDEPLTGHTQRPPGRYQGYATSKGFQPLHFTLKVLPCSLNQYEQSGLNRGDQRSLEEARCAPYEAQLRFSELAPPPATGAQQLKRAGVVTAITGLALLSTHALGLMDYQGLQYTQSLSDKRGALERGQLWSYGLLTSGALLYGAGLLWPALSTDPATEEGSP